MVDLEAHLAPGLDDGAATRDIALEMCRLAAASGVRELVVAVRTDLEAPFDRAEVNAVVEDLQAEVGDTLFLHSSCVVALSWTNAAHVFREPQRYAINGLRYLPLEITPEMLARAGIDKLFSALYEAGLQPVLSRPERSSAVRGDLRRLRHWVERGALVQITAGALTGLYGERAQLASIRIIDAGLAHFVASCGRSAGGRAPVLDQAYFVAADRWGEALARRLFIDNPWAALWGDDIEY